MERLRFLRKNLEARRTGRFSARALICLLLAGLSFVALKGNATLTAPPVMQSGSRNQAVKIAQPSDPVIWKVEDRGEYSVYSNGLQIRTDYLTQSNARRYHTFSREKLTRSPELTKPAGIVFHTTESLLLPLQPAHNNPLVRTREELLNHVRDGRLYNFVIDRFGQVFRIVPEDQVAHHAGHSVWADSDSIYEGLNESFLGISFEARTGPAFEPTAAQIRSGRMLTEALRALYQIPERNCVTHAQVSVNPDNLRIGYHTDWAANFPFAAFGLSSGYGAPVAAVEIFGFSYDEEFIRAIGGRAWDGLVAAEDRISRGAQERGLPPDAYRDTLRKRYQQIRSHLL